MPQVFLRSSPIPGAKYLYVTVVVQGTIVMDSWIRVTSGRAKSNRAPEKSLD